MCFELQPPGAGPFTLFHHGRKRRNRKDLAGHRDLIALVAECLAEDPLALAQPVHLGGVEEVDAQCAGPMDDVAGGPEA